MKIRLLPPAVLLVLATLAASAFAASLPGPRVTPGDPVRNCATPEPTLSEMARTRVAIEDYVRDFGALAVGGQIKVAWHVIYSGTTGNIPQSQIDAQIAELNKAYSGFYGGVNTGYTFALASVDRTNNSQWFAMTPGGSAERKAKRALATDVPHRFNIYSCKPGQNLLGWSYFPQSYSESNSLHGVVIHYGSVPGGYLAPYNQGGTADHEAGHYLGLYHTFQGGCTAPGDYVDDTPFEASPNYGCPASRNTCSSAGLDPINNYMDYSDDVCYTNFTAGQDARMDAIVPVYRPSLLNAALALSGGGLDPESGRSSLTPQSVSFRGAFPNPFRSETRLRFYLPRKDRVSLKVYNVAGQQVAALADGEMSPGEQSLTLDGRGLAPGMYFAALRVGGVLFGRSVLLVR